MSEQEPLRFVHLPHPTQCVLWEHPDRISGKFSDTFEEVESYEDGNHLIRSLYKCRECGQLYFYEFYEWVDWNGGNDRMYTTFIPVQTREQIEELKAANPFMLMTYLPRLQVDGKPIWMGKE